MAYIQLTTRCQMTCGHCAYSCEPGKGEDMTDEIFQAALEFSTDHSEYITLGGGEPTLHPNFWHYLIDCISHKHVEGVWLATNGGNTDVALKLAELAKKGVVAVDLSLDEWHDPISDEVIHAFTEGMVYDGVTYSRKRTFGDERSNDLRNVRTITNPMPTGRAAELVEATNKSCVCDDVIISPNGDMFLCGCDDSLKLGNILTGYQIPETEDGYPYHGCIQEYELAQNIKAA